MSASPFSRLPPRSCLFDSQESNRPTLTPAPPIVVTFPNGGEDWRVGTRQNITWTSDNVTGLVRIDVSWDGGSTWRNIIAYTNNDGNQTWIVTGPATTEARVRVVSSNNRAVFDVSDTNFTIARP